MAEIPSDIPGNMKPYWQEREQLHHTKEGLVMRGEQIVVPRNLHKQMLEKLHENHQGITNTKK